jgi:hypothetical protein
MVVSRVDLLHLMRQVFVLRGENVAFSAFRMPAHWKMLFASYPATGRAS